MKQMIIFLFTLSAFAFMACERCMRESTAYDDVISFKLLNKRTSQNLLGFDGKYHMDSVKIYNIDGKAIFKGPVELSGIIDFGFVDRATDYIAIDAPLTKTYYVYLNQADTDTLTTQFQLKKDECGKDQLSSLNIFYNGLLIHYSTTSNIYEIYK